MKLLKQDILRKSIYNENEYLHLKSILYNRVIKIDDSNISQKVKDCIKRSITFHFQDTIETPIRNLYLQEIP